MKKLFLILCIFVLLLTACAIKEDQLVVMEGERDEKDKLPDYVINIHFDTAVQKKIIENNSTVLKDLPFDLIPIAVSPDSDIILAYSNIPDAPSEMKNRNVVTGNMIGMSKLYAYKPINQSKKELGNFLSIRDYKFDESGKMFAFIDGDGNVYIYNLSTEQLDKILSRENYKGLSTLSWSRDSKKLMFDTKVIFDISSKEFISIAAESLTPFIKHKFNSNTYVVQMKNIHYYDMITLYDFNNKNYTFIANGIYSDCDNDNVLYTKNTMNDLYLTNLKTMENKLIHEGQIYKSCILKSTGDIIYSTLNSNLQSRNRYNIIKLDPVTGLKQSLEAITPTFYLSPSEDKLSLIGDYFSNELSIELSDFSLTQKLTRNEDQDIFKIKTTILKMFKLDYEYSGSYEGYEALVKKIYVNTYDLGPQEALENKLIDYKRFNMPLPGMYKETYIPSLITIDPIIINKNHASVNLGQFFINSLEMIRIYDDWYITGFSTHPNSNEVKEIKILVKKYLNEIKNKNLEEVWKLCKNNEEVVTELIQNADKLDFQVGEVELWSMSDPHRSELSEQSSEAKVKIVIIEGNKQKKYKLILSKNHKKAFEIISWKTDPLSISQLY